MLVNQYVILVIIFAFLIGIYFVHHQNRKLKIIKNKVDDLHHDINSSLVIIKLTIESLKDIPLESQNNALIESPGLVSLISLVEEGVSQIEGSFRHWNVSN